MKAALAAVLILSAAPAFADEPAPKPMRLMGQVAATPQHQARSFVIDALVKPGDGEFQTTVEGWFAGLGEEAPHGEITGACVERRCALTFDSTNGKLSLTGDFGGATGPTPARFVLKDDDNKVLQQGTATLSPLAGAVPGIGQLAPVGAVSAAALDDLLLWSQQSVGFGGHEADEPPSSFQRDTLADWQTLKGRQGTGLITVADLAELRAESARAHRESRWMALGDAAHGWSAGYPAALLPKASRAGTEQRFASADGHALLTLAIEAPLTDEAFSALVEKITADNDGRSSVNYSRVNNDLTIRYEEGGKVTAAAYHNRAGGLARLSFTYPASDEAYGPYETLVQASLVVTDDLKR